MIRNDNFQPSSIHKDRTMKIYKGKVAVVTGGASGIGRCLSLALAKSGATVIVADINLETANKVVAEITKAGGKSQAVLLDVTKQKNFTQVIEEIFEEYGRLDFLFNNAGIAVIGSLRDINIEDCDRMIDINIRGVLHGVKAVYPIFIKQGSGHIINTASLAGLVPAPILSAYAATKHAVVGLSTSLRLEAAANNIRVSAVCPSAVSTPLLKSKRVNVTDDMMSGFIKKFGVIEPEECVDAIMRGVAKNQALIIVPNLAHMSWRAYRLVPNLIYPLLQLTMKNLRYS